MSRTAVQLDHVVVLLPYKDITDPPEWITKIFTVSPGGRHADGRTENRLILFRDGTYLELIAFVNDSPEKRKGHGWDRSFGVVDYALTTPGPYDFDALRARLEEGEAGVEYAGQHVGGRTRPDGVELKWETTFPKDAVGFGVPFWCRDLTPRERRVPVTDVNTEHPCGAVGMGAVLLKVDGSKSERLGRAMYAITEDRENAVSTPLNPSLSNRPTLQVEQGNQVGKYCKISLVLQTLGTRPPVDIQEEIGDGQVAIRFEGIES